MATAVDNDLLLEHGAVARCKRGTGEWNSEQHTSMNNTGCCARNRMDGSLAFAPPEGRWFEREKSMFDKHMDATRVLMQFDRGQQTPERDMHAKMCSIYTKGVNVRMK